MYRNEWVDLTHSIVVDLQKYIYRFVSSSHFTYVMQVSPAGPEKL